jgi:hypothetical protein
MHLGYVEYYVPSANPGESSTLFSRRAAAGSAIRGAVGNGLFNQLDANGDGAITREEVRQRLPNNPSVAGHIFDALDRDGNGKLEKSELSRLENLR